MILMGQVEGKTEAQGRKGKTPGLSATQTGLKSGHIFRIPGSGQSFGASGLAAKTGRGKVSRK